METWKDIETNEEREMQSNTDRYQERETKKDRLREIYTNREL